MTFNIEVVKHLSVVWVTYKCLEFKYLSEKSPHLLSKKGTLAAEVSQILPVKCSVCVPSIFHG